MKVIVSLFCHAAGLKPLAFFNQKYSPPDQRGKINNSDEAHVTTSQDRTTPQDWHDFPIRRMK